MSSYDVVILASAICTILCTVIAVIQVVIQLFKKLAKNMSGYDAAILMDVIGTILCTVMMFFNWSRSNDDYIVYTVHKVVSKKRKQTKTSIG